MKKGLIFSLLAGFVIFFSGCIKNGTNLTIHPYMTASLGTYTFSAATIEPSLSKPQLNDSTTILTITGDEPSISNRVVIYITKYKELTGTFSIADGEAGAVFYHNGITSTATSGVVAISNVGVNTITGYFSFSAADGTTVSSGDFVCGRPWLY